MRFFAAPRPATRTLFALFLAAPLLPGCLAGGGSFGPDGFHHADFPIAVHFTKPEAKEFLGPDWRIDNFYVDDFGFIGSPKSSSEYVGREAVDFRGDGHVTRLPVYFFDLKLDHRKSSAVIWMQSVRLGRNDTERNLRTLVEDYAEALSGSGFYATVHDGLVVKAKSYAAKIVAGTDTTLGGLPAYDAKLEVANLDQIRLDPNARATIVRVVLVRTNYVRNWGGPQEGPLDARTLVRLGYRANPSDFDANMPDFEKFLTLVEFGPPTQADH
jgi:hypothetical protein